MYDNFVRRTADDRRYWDDANWPQTPLLMMIWGAWRYSEICAFDAIRRAPTFHMNKRNAYDRGSSLGMRFTTFASIWAKLRVTGRRS